MEEGKYHSEWIHVQHKASLHNVRTSADVTKGGTREVCQRCKDNQVKISIIFRIQFCV